MKAVKNMITMILPTTLLWIFATAQIRGRRKSKPTPPTHLAVREGTFNYVNI